MCSRSDCMRPTEIAVWHAVPKNTHITVYKMNRWYTQCQIGMGKRRNGFGLVHQMKRSTLWTISIRLYIWIKMRHSVHWFQTIWHHVPSHPTIRIRDTFHICTISNSIDWHSFGVFRFLLILLFVRHFWKICLLLKLQMIHQLNGSVCSGTWHDAPHFSWSSD